MEWLFALIGLVVIVVIALLVVGRETDRLARSARPAVFDLTQATAFIAERLSPETQARISHDDVRWVLLADADLLEEATADPNDRKYPWSRATRVVAGRPIPVRNDAGEIVNPDDGDSAEPLGQVVDEDVAVARLLALAEASGRDLADEDIAAVLDARLGYLEQIGAVGGVANDPGAPT